MSVKYDGKRLIPAPFAGIGKTMTRTGDGTAIGSDFNITLVGRLLPDRGSPGSGSFYTGDSYPPDEVTNDNFGSLLAKRELLEDLFSDDGLLLEFESCNGTPLQCYPTIISIDTPEEQHYTYTDYTITLRTHAISGLLQPSDNFSQYIDSASETWDLEHTNEYEGPELAAIARLTHNVSAVGKRVYDAGGTLSEGWQQAQQWVLARVGLDTSFTVGTSGLNLPGYYTGYDYLRTENSNELDGTYTVAESWVISSGAVLEEFSINTTESLDTYRDRVSAQGNIRGLEVRSSDYYTVSTTKWTNALAKYNQLVGSSDVNTIYNRALAYSGFSNLNPAPLSKVVGKNPTGGTISYTFDYDTRRTNFISGAKYEEISVNDEHASDIHGEVFTIGRIGGPVLQDPNTVTSTKRSLSIDVVMEPYSGATSITTVAGVAALYGTSPKSGVDEVVNAFYTDLVNNHSQVFKDSDTDNWSIKDGRYVRNVSWTYGSCSGVI